MELIVNKKNLSSLIVGLIITNVENSSSSHHPGFYFQIPNSKNRAFCQPQTRFPSDQRKNLLCHIHLLSTKTVRICLWGWGVHSGVNGYKTILNPLVLNDSPVQYKARSSNTRAWQMRALFTYPSASKLIPLLLESVFHSHRNLLGILHLLLAVNDFKYRPPYI